MFQGYTQGAIDFLWGLKLNNERAWFQEHKQEFTDLVDRPTRELATQLTEDIRIFKDMDFVIIQMNRFSWSLEQFMEVDHDRAALQL